MAGGCRRFLTRSTCSLGPNTSTGEVRGKEGVNPGVYQDSVLPVIESGQAEIVDGEGAVGDRPMLHSTLGQTVGHVAIKLRSGEHSAVFSRKTHTAASIALTASRFSSEVRIPVLCIA
jgi:hypothetical protein